MGLLIYQEETPSNDKRWEGPNLTEGWLGGNINKEPSKQGQVRRPSGRARLACLRNSKGPATWAGGQGKWHQTSWEKSFALRFVDQSILKSKTKATREFEQKNYIIYLKV